MYIKIRLLFNFKILFFFPPQFLPLLEPVNYKRGKIIARHLNRGMMTRTSAFLRRIRATGHLMIRLQDSDLHKSCQVEYSITAYQMVHQIIIIPYFTQLNKFFQISLLILSLPPAPPPFLQPKTFISRTRRLTE